MSKVTGLDQAISKLLDASKEFQQEVKEIVEFRTGEIETKAIADAPAGGDRINTTNGSILLSSVGKKGFTPINQAIGYVISSDGYKGSVFVEKSAGEVAAYVEFSTGQDAASYLATVEPEWREQAKKFYVNGKGTIIGKPYLYPNYLKQRTEFLKDLTKLVKGFKI